MPKENTKDILDAPEPEKGRPPLLFDDKLKKSAKECAKVLEQENTIEKKNKYLRHVFKKHEGDDLESVIFQRGEFTEIFYDIRRQALEEAIECAPNPSWLKVLDSHTQKTYRQGISDYQSNIKAKL